MPKGFGNQGTNCLSVTIMALVVLQIAIGLACIILVEVYKSSLLKYVGRSERDEFQVALFFMDLFGAQLAIYYSCGLPLIKKCTREPCAQNIGALLSLWHFFIFIAILNGFLMSYMLFRSSDSIENSAEMSLLRGIEVYYSDAEWRLTWDDLQYHEECCGVKDYKDWQSTAWIEETREGSAGGRPCSSEMISLTPYSCCKRNAGCLENYIPHKTSESWMELPTLNVSAINTTGCLSIFSNELQTLLILMLSINGSVLIIELVILILMRILFVQAQKYCLTQTSDPECQATVILKCPKNFQCEITPDSEFEEADSEEQDHRKSCPCKERRRVSFGCDDDEFSPLLLH